MAFSFSSSGKNSRSARTAGVGEKLGATLFFSFFLALGLLAAWFLGAMIFQSLATYTWTKTPAKILHSAVGEDTQRDSPFSVEVRFQYEWNGQTHISTKYRPQTERSSQHDTIQKQLKALPAGKTVTCLVNPARPTEAILRRSSPWFGLFILIPLVFATVGGGGIFFTWAAPPSTKSTKSTKSADPKSPQNEKRTTLWMGGIFTLIGAGLLIFWILPSMTKAVASQNWTETSCTVITSRVKSHRGDDSTTYSVDIFYRYLIGNQEYQSNRFRIFGGSSSGREAKAEIVEKYPAGSQQVCYVNPQNPAEAVLQPGVGWMALLGLIPLVFLLLGLAILMGNFRKTTGSAASGLPGWSSPNAEDRTEPLPLKPKVSPAGKAIGIVMAAILWNGIVSVFLWQLAKGFQRGHPDWFLTLFLVPFVAIGLGLLGGIIYFALALMNPRCRLQIHPAIVIPGATFTTEWEFHGAVHRMSQVTISLQGQEEAVFQGRKSSHTDRQVFASFPLALLTTRSEMLHGTAQLQLPVDTMPSFTADHNKITWSLKVHGKISHWPDVVEEYPLVILPAKTPAP